MACAGFWWLGKTDLAKAYVIPTLIAGTLLVIIGVGLLSTNISRTKSFETSYQEDASGFLMSENKRIDATIIEYKNVVFTAIPIIIIICSLLLIFIEIPIWRASVITTIAMLSVILLVDGNA